MSALGTDMNAREEALALYHAHAEIRETLDAVWDWSNEMRCEPTPAEEMLEQFRQLTDALERFTLLCLDKATWWAKEVGQCDAETILDFAERLHGRY